MPLSFFICRPAVVFHRCKFTEKKPNRFPPLSQNGLNPFHRLLPASRFRVDSDGSRSSRSPCSCHTTSDVVCSSVEIFSDDIASSFLTLHARSKRREQIIVFVRNLRRPRWRIEWSKNDSVLQYALFIYFLDCQSYRNK